MIVEWETRAIPDRSGDYAFVEMVRADDDPERLPREQAGEDNALRWKRTFKKSKPADWGPRVLELLADGTPRTMHRIGVELVDLDGSIVAGSPLGEAVWALVEAGALEFTMVAPIFFRRVEGPHLEPDYEAARRRVEGDDDGE